jgi:hypothetical protein
MTLAIGVWQAFVIGVLIFGILFLSFIINFIKKQKDKK